MERLALGVSCTVARPEIREPPARTTCGWSSLVTMCTLSRPVLTVPESGTTFGTQPTARRSTPGGRRPRRPCRTGLLCQPSLHPSKTARRRSATRISLVAPTLIQPRKGDRVDGHKRFARGALWAPLVCELEELFSRLYRHRW